MHKITLPQITLFWNYSKASNLCLPKANTDLRLKPIRPGPRSNSTHLLTPQIGYLALWLFCVGRVRLQGRKHRAGSTRKFWCLAWPCGTGLPGAVSRVLPSLRSWLSLCKPPPEASTGREAPGPAGSLWRLHLPVTLNQKAPPKE